MLKPHDISGGIDLDEFAKEPLAEFSSLEFVEGEEVRIPLTSHVGRDSTPCVEVGQQVKQFETVAVPNGPVSVAQHAPCSGVVTGLIENLSSQGLAGVSQIVLKCDGKRHTVSRGDALDIGNLSNDTSLRNEVERRITDAGIVGMGGAGFPAHLKLHEGIHTEIEDFIINGVECEPLARSDRYLLESRLDEILTGAKIIKDLLQPKRCVLAIGPWIDEKQLEKTLADTGIQLLQTTSRYPSGSEKQLIEILRNKELPLNRLPIHIGVVCFNVATIQAMYRAAVFSRPCVSRTLTVNARRRLIVEAPIGMTFGLLLQKIGEPVTAQTDITTGGMMMARAVTAQAPITKLTHEMSIHERVRETLAAAPCIRCGECASVCPIRLQPQKLYELASLGDLDSIQDYGLFDCIECGCCSYVCPSNIPLVQYFINGKFEVNELGVLATQRNVRRERFVQHESRKVDKTPAARHAALAEIPTSDDDGLDNELEKLRERIAERRNISDHDG